MRTDRITRSSISRQEWSRKKSYSGGFIPKSDFVDDIPSEVGQQIRINHVNCTQGVDTRRRLYVKRISPNTVVAYCHNCGKKGVVRTAAQMVRTRIIQKVCNSRLPDDFTPEIPVKYKAYLYKYRFTDSMIAQYGIGYSPALDRIVIPLKDGDKQVGWAARSLYETPKWVYPDNFNKSKYLITEGIE